MIPSQPDVFCRSTGSWPILLLSSIHSPPWINQRQADPPLPYLMLHPPQIYKQQAVPVEDFFRASGLLADFEITGGIPETLPSLLASLQRFVPKNLA